MSFDEREAFSEDYKATFDAAKAAAAKPQEFENLPDGDYIADIIEAEPGKTKDGRDKFYLVYQIVRGAMENRRVWRHYPFPDGIEWLLRDLNTLEFQVDSMNDLIGGRNKMLGTRVKINLKTNDKGRQNMKIKELLEKPTALAAEDDGYASPADLLEPEPDDYEPEPDPFDEK